MLGTKDYPKRYLAGLPAPLPVLFRQVEEREEKLASPRTVRTLDCSHAVGKSSHRRCHGSGRQCSLELQAQALCGCGKNCSFATTRPLPRLRDSLPESYSTESRCATFTSCAASTIRQHPTRPARARISSGAQASYVADALDVLSSDSMQLWWDEGQDFYPDWC